MIRRLGCHPYGDLIDFQSHRKKWAEWRSLFQSHAVAPSGPSAASCFQSAWVLCNRESPSTVQGDTQEKKKKKHQVLRALKLGGLFQKLHDAQVYLSTSVPAVHFYLDGAPQSKLSRRVDVINCLDEYRSIGSLRDLRSSRPLVAPICREVNHWVPLGQRGRRPIYSAQRAGRVVCSIQRTLQCGPWKWCLWALPSIQTGCLWKVTGAS